MVITFAPMDDMKFEMVTIHSGGAVCFKRVCFFCQFSLASKLRALNSFLGHKNELCFKSLIVWHNRVTSICCFALFRPRKQVGNACKRAVKTIYYLIV